MECDDLPEKTTTIEDVKSILPEGTRIVDFKDWQ